MNCKEYNFKLNKPCNLKACPYNINCEQYNNCLNIYSEEFGSSPMKESLIGKFYNKQPKEVDDAIKLGLNDIRVKKLENFISGSNDLEFIENSNVCVVCGKQCSKPIPLHKGSKLCYCSYACSNKIPYKLILLMNRLGTDARSVLIAMVRAFPGVVIQEMLGISLYSLKVLFNNMFNINITNITNDSFESDFDFDEIYKPNVVHLDKKYALIDDEILQDCVLFNNL